MIEYELKKLESYKDVKQGDYFPNFFSNIIVGSKEKDDMVGGIVTYVNINKEYFAGLGRGYDRDFRISGPQIKNVILLRKRDNRLELLAGENILEFLKTSMNLT